MRTMKMLRAFQADEDFPLRPYSASEKIFPVFLARNSIDNETRITGGI